MIATVLAATSSSDAGIWTDLLEVVGYGLVAGIGLSIAFALAMRGWILGATAQRDGRGGTAAGQFTLAVVFSAVCIVAVGFALVTMLHR